MRADTRRPPVSSGGLDDVEPVPAAGDRDFRERRLARVAEARRRTGLLVAADPTADPQLVYAVAAADRLWGPDEQWRQAIGPVDGGRAVVGRPGGDSAADGAPAGSHGGVGFRVLRRLPVVHRLRSRSAAGNGGNRTAGHGVLSGSGGPFDVPGPGRPTRRVVGGARSWVTRLLLLVAPLLLVGGVAFWGGVSSGSARLVAPSSIGAEEAAAYHLSTFPAQQAAAFGVSYLTLCLTHPDAGDATGTAGRLAGLARMASAGLSAGCGWTGGPAAAAPLAVAWDGTVKPAQGRYDTGSAAVLGFLVTLADGRTVGAALPIWVAGASGAAGIRVVGDVAFVPAAPPAAAAPTPVAPPVVDSTMEDAVSAGVLLPFLRAWGASDGVQLNLVLAGDATVAARTGMDGQLSDPSVSRAQVVVTRGDPAAGYRDGDVVTAQVLVDWTAREFGAQRSGYSIVLRMTAGRWQVVDIAGAAPDPVGGAAPGTAFPTTTTALPSPSAG
jgi:hypothetical protein